MTSKCDTDSQTSTGNICGGVLTSSLPLQPPLRKHFLVFRRVLRLHLVLRLVAILGVVAAPLLSMHEVERHTLGSEQDTTCTHSRRHDAIFCSTGAGETLPAHALMSLESGSVKGLAPIAPRLG